MDNKKGCNLGIRVHPWDSRSELSVKFLFEPRTLARAVAQEEQTRPADFVVTFDNDLVDAGGTIEECALDTDAIAGNAADGESGVIPILMGKENGSLEFLDTFAGTFLDFHMHTDGITSCKSRDLGIYGCINRFHQVSHLTHLAMELRFIF